MAFDGILLSQLTIELNDKLVGGRIDKIHQPEKDELTVHIRGTKASYILFTSVDASMPYLTLTKNKKENPASPPMFCMLMRKHLVGGRILNIAQHGNERVLIFTIEAKNELGDTEKKQLIIEIMGKHSNVILTKEDLTIIDSIKRISPDMSRVRSILPGLKFDFIPTDQVLLSENIPPLWANSDENTPLLKMLYRYYQGFSPSLSKYLLRKSNIDFDTRINMLTDQETERLNHSLKMLLMAMTSNRVKGYFFKNGFSKNDFYFLEDWIPESEVVFFDALSDTIDSFYNQTNRELKMHQKTQNLKRTLQQRIDRSEGKLNKLKLELKDAENADIYKVKGELLLANIYSISKGQNTVTVDNYYENPPTPVTIDLDVRLEPAQNAQLYFKRYNKFKVATTVLEEQIKETNQDLQYFEQTLTHLENSEDFATVEEIRNELASQGIIKNRYIKKFSKKSSDEFRVFKTTDGFDVLVGKNNHQNDLLTLKTASNKDIWFHTKIIPGSHVVLRTYGENPSENSIKEAAEIAAYYSKARLSSNVPVDYTLIKNVSKPNGAKPGMVIYVNYKTIFVTPDEDKVSSLKV